MILAALLIGAYIISPPVSPPSQAPSSGGSELTQAIKDAQQFHNYGQFDRSRALLLEIIQKYPDHLEARKLLAETLVASKKLPEAYEQLSAALKLDPNQEEIQFFAGVVAAQLEKHDWAALHYDRAAHMAPGSAKYPLYLGTALLALNETAAAEEQARRALSLDSQIPETYTLLAKIDEKRTHYKEAIAHADSALKLLDPQDPKQTSHGIYKAHLLRLALDPKQAVALLLSLDPKPMPFDHAEELARCYQSLHEPLKAAGVWIELFTAEPLSARAAAEAGLCLLQAHRPEEARKYLNLAMRLQPDHPAVQSLAKALAHRCNRMIEARQPVIAIGRLTAEAL